MTRFIIQFTNFFVNFLKSQFRTPTLWVWGFLFPIIFIVLFGFVSGNNETQVNIGLVKNSDSEVLEQIKVRLEDSDIFEVQENSNTETLNELLEDGQLDAVIEIETEQKLFFTYNQNNPENYQIISQTLNDINSEITLQENEITKKSFLIEEVRLNPRTFRYIDFVLPGILGYSLLSSAVFGVSYSFLSLRKTKVLKRLFAAPTIKSAFLLAQSSSRFVFIYMQTFLQLILAIVFFEFTPKTELLGLIQILIVMAIGLIVFFSFGYLVAGLAKTDEVVAPVSNLIVLPQFILGGTFFAGDTFPNWLNYIIQVMPLYHFNRAMRFISIEGLNLWDLKVLLPVSILILWGVVGYYLTSKVFKVQD